MKYKTALQQSISSVKFLSLVIVVMTALVINFPGPYTAVPLAIFVLYCGGGAYNVYRIRREAAKDPTFLDKKLK